MFQRFKKPKPILKEYVSFQIILSNEIGKGAFVLGQEQDSFGGDFSSAESYQGKISQFNLWNTRLNDTQISNIMYSCHDVDENSSVQNEMFPNAINQKHLRESLVISWADFRRENTINGFVKVQISLILLI